jgi:hypothetical protein
MKVKRRTKKSLEWTEAWEENDSAESESMEPKPDSRASPPRSARRLSITFGKREAGEPSKRAKRKRSTGKQAAKKTHRRKKPKSRLSAK